MRNCTDLKPMSRSFIGLLFILFFNNAFAQLSVRFTGSPVESLSKKLTSSCKTDYEKVRSIFLWITDNISYHTRSLPNKRKKIDDDLILETDDTSSTLPPLTEHVAEIVLRRGTAVCDGYTKLFKSLCDHAGIRNEIITGYAKTNFSTGSEFHTNHSWNAVYVDSSWHLLDVTWASGFVYGSLFIKSFDDYYFFTSPRYFIRDHYPEDLQWTLLNNPPLPREMYQSPFVYTEFLRQKIVSFSPAKGIIDATIGDTIHFNIESELPKITLAVSDIEFADSASSEAVTSANGKAEYDYIVNDDKTQWLYVVCNDEIILRYRLNVKNQNKRPE
jgi:transglutaminase/protease-like cytokinesis protein 3